MNRFLKVLLFLAGLWVVGLFLALLYFWPWTGSSEHWLWFLLLGPPAALLLQAAGELCGEWWQGTRLAQAVQRRTEHKRFSWLRVLVALLSVGVLTVVVAGVAVWIR